MLGCMYMYMCCVVCRYREHETHETHETYGTHETHAVHRAEGLKLTKLSQIIWCCITQWLSPLYVRFCQRVACKWLHQTGQCSFLIHGNYLPFFVCFDGVPGQQFHLPKITGTCNFGYMLLIFCGGTYLCLVCFSVRSRLSGCGAFFWHKKLRVRAVHVQRCLIRALLSTVA